MQKLSWRIIGLPVFQTIRTLCPCTVTKVNTMNSHSEQNTSWYNKHRKLVTRSKRLFLRKCAVSSEYEETSTVICNIANRLSLLSCTMLKLNDQHILQCLLPDWGKQVSFEESFRKLLQEALQCNLAHLKIHCCFSLVCLSLNMSY